MTLERAISSAQDPDSHARKRAARPFVPTGMRGRSGCWAATAAVISRTCNCRRSLCRSS